jgi:hypothetical protein
MAKVLLPKFKVELVHAQSANIQAFSKNIKYLCGMVNFFFPFLILIFHPPVQILALLTFVLNTGVAQYFTVPHVIRADSARTPSCPS